LDITLALGIFLAAVANVANQDDAGIGAIPLLGFVLLAAASVALLWRRALPLVALGAALAMMVVWALAGYPGNPVFHMLAALYAVGRYLTATSSSLTALLVALAVAATIQIADGDAASDVVIAGLVTVLPWYVGRRVRFRGEYASAVRERQATEAQRVIDDARSAIARELHDVVAHNVSVMTVQAGVARLVVVDDPERAQEAIQAVEEAGRQTLDELRHLLGVLRPEAGSDDLEPQPALHQIDELVERLEQTGMHISLSMDVASDLSVRVDLFAYRIVQEALTNVLKHAGVDAATDVRIEESGDQILIEVVNTGAVGDALPGSGRGIAGMEERASLLGGTFEAGSLPNGGFRVLARLPMGDE
jgi:signal transduction histidine kinase